MAKKSTPKKQLFCDPGICEHCEYICEGDFICDKKVEPVMVICDWEPTEDFLWCKARGKNNGKRKSKH